MKLSKIIIALVYNTGKYIGVLFSWIPQKACYLFTMLLKGFMTGFMACKFKSFGLGSILPERIKLLNPKFIVIGGGTEICPNTILEAWNVFDTPPYLSIGDNCQIGEYTHITSANSIKIGNGVLVGRFVLISDNNHGNTNLSSLKMPPSSRKVVSKGPIVIEDNVWIGDRAIILGGVNIGKGSVIAANAVVTHDVPPYSVVVGPTAIIRK